MSAAIEDLKTYGLNNKHSIEKEKIFFNRQSES
jgi:hypothetical protein